jgi:TolB-like protein/Tfp pilus assembly protein PilF
MKRCPECRRDYYDESLIFCLDDGSRLLDGPTVDSMPTAIMPADLLGEAATRKFADAATTNETLPATSKSKFLMVGAAAILLALLAWAGFTFYRRGPSSRQIESVAVMPFVNAAGNPDLEYLSDGVTESLIHSLSKIPELSVKARSSVFTYKGRDVTPQQVANDLAVQAVVNGRVQQLGDQVILNVELVDTATGDQIWGDQYTRKMADLLQLQSDIVHDVSGRLREKLSRTDRQKVAKNYTENTEAYQLYLRGRYYWNKRKPDDIRKSIEYFQQAIDRDPAYALAYAALAEAYILVPNYRLGPAGDYYPKARAAAVRAIEIDESLAEAHNALASVICNYDWKFAEAEAEWQKALALNPNYATAHQWYSEYLLSMGRYAEALAEMERAKEIDPLSLIINGMVGVALSLNGRNEEALDQLNKTLEMDPNFPRTHLYLADTYQSMGRFEEALDEYEKHFVLNGVPADQVQALGAKVRNAYRTGGAKAYERAFAQIIEGAEGPNKAPVVVIAGYWARAGEIDKAFALLESAYANHDDAIINIKSNRLEPLKSDPRYKDLLRRIGLPV